MDSVSPQDPAASGDARRKRRRQSSVSAESPRELGQMRMRRDTGSSSFVGSGSGVHFVRTVRNAFASNQSKHHSPEDEEELVPGEDDRLNVQNIHSLLWTDEEMGVPTRDLAAESQPSFDQLVQWSQSYFASWHPPFPFIHAPSVLAVLETISGSGVAAVGHGDLVVVRSVMSISLADRRQLSGEKEPPVPSDLIFQTLEDAFAALQSFIVQPSTLGNLQAVLSIQMFLISMLRLNAASRLGGLIVRMALHLGLHRCPARFRQFSAADVVIRKRVFWSIYCLERYLSQALGLPLGLKDDDVDVCYPGSEFHVAANQEHDDNGQLLLSTYLAKHGRIKGMVLELRNKSVLHSRTDPDEVAHIDAEISRWWNEAQDVLQAPFDGNDEMPPVHNQTTGSEYAPPGHAQSELKTSHKLLLIVQKHESVILLNRPVITSGYNTSAFAAAMQKCIGASKLVITHVYRHISAGNDGGGRVHERKISDPLFWPGFVWVVWQSGLILLYAASEGHYSSTIAQREATYCATILDNLSIRGNFWPGACATAIREIQSALQQQQRPAVNEAVGRGLEPNRTRPNRDLSRSDTQAPRSLQPNNNTSHNATEHRERPTRLNGQSPSMGSTNSPSTYASRHDLRSITNDQPSTPMTQPGTTSRNTSRPLDGQEQQNVAATASTYNNVPMATYNNQGPESFGRFQSNSQVSGSTNQLVDFDNIFQLMDASYQYSEQMGELQPSMGLDFNLGIDALQFGYGLGDVSMGAGPNDHSLQHGTRFHGM